MKNVSEKTVPFNKDLARVIMENIEKKQRYFGDHKLSGRPIWHKLILTPHSGFVSDKAIQATTKELISMGLVRKVWHKGCRVLEVPKKIATMYDEAGQIVDIVTVNPMDRINKELEYQEALEQEEQDFSETLAQKLYSWKMQAYQAEGLTEEEIAERENIEIDKESDWKNRMVSAVKFQIEKTKKDYAEKKAKGYSKVGEWYVQELHEVVKAQQAKDKADIEDAVKMEKTVYRVYEVAKAVFYIALGFSVGVIIGLLG